MGSVSRRKFLEVMLVGGLTAKNSIAQILNRDVPELQRNFNIEIPMPVDNPDYDYNREDLDYIVNNLKESVESYYEKVRELEKPSNDVIFNFYYDLMVELANDLFIYGVKKQIPEFTDLGKKLIKGSSINNKNIRKTLKLYFDHFDLYFLFRMDNAPLETGSYMMYQAALMPIKDKKERNETIGEGDNKKIITFTEVLLGKRIISQYSASNSADAGWTLDNNIYICEEVLEKRGEGVQKRLFGSKSLIKNYENDLDNILESTKERLIEKEWKGDVDYLVTKYNGGDLKSVFLEKYVEKARTSFRFHEMSHIAEDGKDEIANESLAMYWQLLYANKEYEDLAQVVEWIHMHKNSVYHYAGNRVFTTFVTLIINHKNTGYFKNIDYSNVTGLNEESATYVASQLDRLNREQIKTIARTAIENKLYLD